jgi:hypothetical protein
MSHIVSLSHASRVQNMIQDRYNARPIVGRAPLTWSPSADPRTIVERQAFLEKELPQLFLDPREGGDGNVLHTSLRDYVRGLAVEVELGVTK